MRLAGDELEHIDVEPAAAIPARTALAKAGFRHADRIFVTAQSLASQQQRLVGVLISRSGTNDEDRRRQAEARLSAELRDRYADLRRSLRRDWRLRLDNRTYRFGAAIQRTLEPPVGDPAIASQAEQLARSLRERWISPSPLPIPTASTRSTTRSPPYAVTSTDPPGCA